MVTEQLREEARASKEELQSVNEELNTVNAEYHEKIDILNRVNADLEGRLLEDTASPDPEGRDFLARAAERFGLTARGYHRILRVARTIADLAGSEHVAAAHVAEAIGYRRGETGRAAMT